jgi:hypothetical protein
MEAGQPAKAGSIFDALASAAYQRNIPRASQLTLQSGRAWIVAGETERGLDRIREGLKQMVHFQQFRRLPAISQRILEGLRERGLADQASKLEAEINALLSAKGLALPTQMDPPTQPRLPVKCPSCGGTIHPTEVEWVAEDRAVCTYCGSILETDA